MDKHSCYSTPTNTTTSSRSVRCRTTPYLLPFHVGIVMFITTGACVSKSVDHDSIHIFTPDVISSYNTVLAETGSLEILRSCTNATESSSLFPSSSTSVLRVFNTETPILIQVPVTPGSTG